MSLLRNQAIAHQFDKATNYDSVSFIQKDTARMLAGLIARQEALSSPSAILEIGCGTGHLTERLLDLYPSTFYVASDLSLQMLRRTEQKIRQGEFSASNILFHQMDGETLQPPPPVSEVSLIASNLCVQWFPDLPAALEHFAAYLSPGGMICLTTLARDSFQEWRTICNKASISCGIPDYPSLSTLETYWPACGKGQWFMEDLREDVPSARIFLQNLKKIGASLSRPGHRPLSISALKKAMALFDKRYNAVTYQVAFGLFRKDS